MFLLIFVFMKKLFFAFTFKKTKNIELILQQLQTKLKEDKIVWTNPQKLHITIKYLGETKAENLLQIIKIAEDTAKKFSNFTLEANGIKVFGSSYNPKIIRGHIFPNNNINKLYENIEHELIKIGFSTERQNFVPHITLGRIKKLTNKEFFQKLISSFSSSPLLSEKIMGFSLMESIPQKNKPPVYVTIANFNFS
jgi:RNA 2',3'-cyclic 3'-phosphodiesterase